MISRNGFLRAETASGNRNCQWGLLFGLILAVTPNASGQRPAAYGANVTYYLSATGATDTPVANQANGTLASAGSFAAISYCLISTPTKTVCGSAYSSAGRLGSQSSMADSDPEAIPGAHENSNGNADSIDVVTVTGLPLGTYTLVPTVSVHGSGTYNNVAIPGTIGLGICDFDPTGTTPTCINPDVTPSASNYSATFALNPIPFQPGVPFNLILEMGEAARIAQGPASSENTLVTANFLDTMTLTGLAVLDSGGKPVTTFTIASSAGATYGTGGIVVSFKSTLADIKTAEQLGLIDKGSGTLLSLEIEAAADTRGLLRTDILKVFLFEVNAEAGKHITGVAPSILVDDANALISQASSNH